MSEYNQHHHQYPVHKRLLRLCTERGVYYSGIKFFNILLANVKNKHSFESFQISPGIAYLIKCVSYS